MNSKPTLFLIIDLTRLKKPELTYLNKLVSKKFILLYAPNIEEWWVVLNLKLM